MFAACWSMPGITWLYTWSVKATVACPSRSLTTFAGTPALSAGGCVGVSHIMQSDPRKAGGVAMLVEPRGDCVRVQWLTVGANEEQRGVLAEEATLLPPRGQELPKRLQRNRVECKGTFAARGLGARLSRYAVDDDPGDRGGYAAVVQIDVVAAQSGEFAAAETRGDDQEPQRVEPVILDAVHEGEQLFGCPDLWPGRQRAGRVSVLGDVARQIVPSHGVSERSVEHAMNVLCGLWGETSTAFDASLGQQASVQQIEPDRCELTEPGVAINGFT